MLSGKKRGMLKLERRVVMAHEQTHKKNFNHHQVASGRRFFVVTLLNVIITGVELIGGVLAGSLALISDGVHNISDAASVVMSYWANKIGKRQPTYSKTFGFARAEIIAALLNSVFLITISLGLSVEALVHLFKPEKVDGNMMLFVAVGSFIFNLAATLLLSAQAHHNLNIKATYLHLLSDALASLGVIVGAIVIKVWQINWLDPLITLVVAGYISLEAIPIIKQTVAILMQGSPQLDYPAIYQDLRALDGVVNVHHFHAWSVDEHQLMMSLHVNLKDCRLSDAEKTYRQIERILKDKYHATHVTIQAECQRGKDEHMLDCSRNDHRFAS